MAMGQAFLRVLWCTPSMENRPVSGSSSTGTQPHSITTVICNVSTLGTNLKTKKLGSQWHAFLQIFITISQPVIFLSAVESGNRHRHTSPKAGIPNSYAVAL
jgi:hypothetical protein